jgi:hypothetical protein
LYPDPYLPHFIGLEDIALDASNKFIRQLPPDPCCSDLIG